MKHSKNEQLMARKAAATPRGVGVMGTFFAERAQGAELWDAEGQRFIDFAGGIAVMNVGHGHPKVVAAITEQAARFTHTCYQVVPYESYVSLAEKLNALAPGNHAKKTALFSTGAEAIENAVKIARAHTRRSGVIAFGGAFHGRSMFAVSLTGKVQPYKAGFGPFPPEIYHAPFPCHCTKLDDVKRAVQHLFKADIEPSRVAAIVFEPVQGEGGFNVIQADAVRWLRDLCDEHGIVLIADEVQTGFGRTGRMFAMEHFGIAPDLMTIAKSLAAGVPLSAVTGRAEIMDAPAPGGLGGTYAGNPLAVAAAHAVIDIMRDEKLPERGAMLGDRLKATLESARAGTPKITDVRGLGAMVAVEFTDADTAKQVQARALQRGLILLTCGVEGNVIRFLFPLTVSESVFAEAEGILRDALRDALVKEALAAQGVHTLIAQFTDLHGVAKGKFVPLAHLDALLTDGAGFSGPSIAGTGLPRMGPRSEYWARGDATTIQPLPWMPGYARVVCDGFVAGKAFDGCPRQVLRSQLAKLAQAGFTMQTGIEPEFFLLQRDADGRLRPADDHDRLDKPSYDLKSLPRQRAVVEELTAALIACGLDVLQIDHEDAHGQYELNFRHADVLTSADRLMLFKMGGHAIAEKHGRVFSMMPRPFAGQPGSGMHFHVSLWRGDKVADEATLRRFVGGVLAHAGALAAIAAPTVNSYKRLTVFESITGTSWAPAYVAHGPNNRTCLVRTLPGRFEWRLPDASANPYLATAALIAAGLDGIARGLDPGPACDDDLFALPLASIRERGIRLLPQRLDAAIDALEADEVLLGALGPTLAHEFVAAKRDEWHEFAGHVSEWEQRRYGAAF